VFSTGQNCQLENLLLMGFNLPAAAGARASQQRTLVQEASGCLIIRLLAFFPRLLLISMWPSNYFYLAFFVTIRASGFTVKETNKISNLSLKIKMFWKVVVNS
jgi:hypothetical protein